MGLRERIYFIIFVYANIKVTIILYKPITIFFFIKYFWIFDVFEIFMF